MKFDPGIQPRKVVLELRRTRRTTRSSPFPGVQASNRTVLAQFTTAVRSRPQEGVEWSSECGRVVGLASVCIKVRRKMRQPALILLGALQRGVTANIGHDST